jgi:ABC-type transport system involved in multi-copper enzyme maturation permease subunit
VIGLGVLVSALSAHEYELGTKGVRASWDPTSISVAGLSLGQLAIGVLGVILIASEYSTGSIRASLAAVPRRARLLASKGLVLVGGTLVIIEATVFVAFFLGQLMMSGHAPTASLGQPDVVRALVGSALYTALFGLLGLALGAIVRSAAGAIAILVGIVFVVPLISLALPSSIQDNLNKDWPTEAGQQVSSVVRTAHTLSPWAGFALMCGFVGVVLLAAFFTMGRRDA